MVEGEGRGADRAPDVAMDLRGTPCPLNWVKTKLRLEQMEPGMLLDVLVDEGNPEHNVPRSAEAEGHLVQVTPASPGVHILIEKR